jgi:hypothetical protein
VISQQGSICIQGFGDRYITDEDTSIWDLGSTNTSIVIDAVAPIGYKLICSGIQKYVVVYNVIQRGAMVHSGRQWSSKESHTLT